MLHRERRKPEHVYPPDEWRMVEKQFYPRFLPVTETMFAVSNGYFGLRGNFEEGFPVFQNGAMVNGFYESWPIIYGEEAYGFAKTGQTIVNVTDSKIIKLYVDDEPLVLSTANLLSFERVLDLRTGILEREILWETPSGKHVSITSSRLVSLQHRHIAAISYQVTVLNADAPVVISSEIALPQEESSEESDDPRLAKGFKERVLLPRTHNAHDRRIVLSHETRNSKMKLACGIDHTLYTESSHSYTSKCAEDAGKVIFSVEGQAGMPIHLTKYITYHTSATAAPEELCDRAEWTLDRAVGHGFEQLRVSQKQYLDDFWHRGDVQLVTDPTYAKRTTLEMQQAIRFNLFQILQASARAEDVGVPAKGLTGLGYEGHYFWDTEVYILPFLVYTVPQIAKNLLKFRYSFLDKARERAEQVNQKGALFPWRTINGDEASAFFEAGTAQYHINADIIFGLKKYVDITGDEDFLYDFGADMLVETARLWADLGCYPEADDGKFHIHGVTGPDEYTTVVNDNAYTNLTARQNLHYAAATVRALQEKRPERFNALAQDTGLDLAEIDAWQKAADNMYIPFNEKMGIHPQDDTFLQKKVWDFANTPDDKYPLLLHFHPLVIYRHQVIKQADIVLGMFLFGQEFSAEQKKRNFDYYDPLTTGDSSLSACVQSIVASEVGYPDKASDYSRFATLVDLEDIAGNVKDGCHIASMGGTWMVSVYGFAGMRDYDGHLSFRPRLPKQLEGLRFALMIRGQDLEVYMTPESATYVLRQGSELTITHEEQEVHLVAGTPVTIKL